MKNNFRVALVLALTLVPSLAFAAGKPGASGAHMRPQLFHDRSPKVHVHTIAAHH